MKIERWTSIDMDGKQLNPFGKAFIERRADRLLFGTDYYDLKQVEFSQFGLFEQIQVTRETRDKISRKNARRLLELA